MSLLSKISFRSWRIASSRSLVETRFAILDKLFSKIKFVFEMEKGRDEVELALDVSGF